MRAGLRRVVGRTSLGRLSGVAAVRAALIVALVVPAIILAVFAARDYRQAHREAELLASNLAGLLAEHAGRLFEAGDFVIGQVVRMAGPAGQPLPRSAEDWAALRELLQATPYLVSIWIGDDRGDAVLTTRMFPAPAINAADRPYFQEPRDQPEALHIGRLRDDRYSHSVLINMSRRLQPIDGPFRGFARVSVDPHYLRRFYESIDIGYDTFIWLVDKDLKPLLREPMIPWEQLVAAPTEAAYRPVTVGGGTFVANSPIEGRERLYGHRQVAGYDVHVLVGIDRADIVARWRGRLWQHALLSFAGLAAILLMGGLAQRAALRERGAQQGLEQRVRERTAELEKAVGERELLLLELHHRVKNSLQLVMSLLRMQRRDAGEGEPGALVDDAYRRVLTISRLHNRLALSEGVSHVDFGRYLQDLCCELEQALAQEAGRLRIDVRADSVYLPSATAVNLALIVNELVTNSAKHAISADGDQEVQVVFAREEGGGLSLCVADRGPGLEPGVEGQRSGGMGLPLVRALAEQLGGSLRVTPGAPGTRFAIHLPQQGIALAGPPEADGGRLAASGA